MFDKRSRSKQVCQLLLSLIVVSNIPVGPNRTGLFHLMYEPKFPKFLVEWKVPLGIELWSSRKEGRTLTDCVNPYFFP